MFIYLLAVSGVMIHLHYCGQTLASWTVFEQADGCGASACGNESKKKHDCCKDEVIAAKITDEQQHLQSIKLTLSEQYDLDAGLPVFYTAPAVVLADNNPGTIQNANAPPGRWQDIPLYRLLSSYTYYG